LNQDITKPSLKLEIIKIMKTNIREVTIELAATMIGLIPEYVWKNPNATFIDVCMQTGSLVNVVILKLRSCGYSDENIRKRVFGFAENSYMLELAKYKYHLIGIYGVVDILTCKIDKTKGIYFHINNKDYCMKFTVSLLNPPYNGKKLGNGDGAGKAIWPPFIEAAFNVLEDDGYMCAIHPSNWRFGKSRTLFPAQNILFNNQIVYLKTQMPFPGVGTLVDYYVVQKKIAEKPAEVDFLDGKKEFNIHGKIRYINHYQSDIVNSILEKVFKTEDNGLQCVWGWGGGWKNVDKTKPQKNYEWIKGPNKLKKYGYPHINHFDKKVIGRVSRDINAFYDNGNIGMGDHNYFLLVPNDIQGKFLETIWNSKLMLFLQKFNSTYFWDGDNSFRNSEVPFKRIIPEDAVLTCEQDIYDHYKLNQSQIDFIKKEIV